MKKGWSLKKLSEACLINPKKNEIKSQLNDEDLVSFLPMNDLGIQEKKVIPKQTKRLEEVYKGYTYFADNDVLLAKVTPCFENGKLGIVNNLVNGFGFGSSEYIVLRTLGDILPEYLFYFLSTEKFREKGSQLMFGACGLKRLSKDYVDNALIKYPSLSEQQRIVKILDTTFAKIDTIKQNAERNLQNAKELFQSMLIKSYIESINGCEDLKFLSSIKTGKLNANAAVKNGIYPFFTCSREIYSIDDYAFDCEALLLAGNNASGDFNVKHYKGKFNAYQRTYVITVDTAKLVYRYLYYRLLLSLNELKKNANGTNTKFIKLGMIESIKIPKISISEQHQIVAKLDALSIKCKELENNYRQTITDCDEMKKSILAKAFNGEL